MSHDSPRPERLRLPRGREVVLGWAEVGPWRDVPLSPLEREGLERCRTDKRRGEFVAGRLAARRALATLRPGVTAQVTARGEGPDAGRPLLVPEGGVALSLSHAGGLAVAAVAPGGALGVDLERQVEASPAFLEEAFAPGEHEGYLALDLGGLDATTAAWTLKEAVLKVWGVGLRAPLQQVALRPRVLPGREGLQPLRVIVETGPLPPELGTPPRELDAVLVECAPGWVLALAGE